MCNVQVSPELHVVLITCRNVIFYTLLTLSWVSFNLGQPALLNLGQPLFTLLLNKQAGDHIKLVLKLAHNNLFRCSSETLGKHEGFDESYYMQCKRCWCITDGGYLLHQCHLQKSIVSTMHLAVNWSHIVKYLKILSVWLMKANYYYKPEMTSPEYAHTVWRMGSSLPFIAVPGQA